MRANVLALALSAAVAGCSASPAADDLGQADLSQSVADLSGADLGQGQYPAGPYGRAVGDTFPLLAWEGYVNNAADAVSTTKPFGSYSSDDARKSGRAFMMVHVADYI